MKPTVAVLAVCAAAGALIVTAIPAAPPEPAVYRSPYDVAWSPDGRLVAASDATAAAVVLVDPASGKVVREVALRGAPAGVVWAADGSRLYVAECGAGAVAEVDPKAGKVTRRLETGARPMGLALATKRGMLVVTDAGTGAVSLVDFASGKEKARLDGFHTPEFVAVTPDESLAVITNLMPGTPASDPATSASVMLVDLEKGEVAGEVRLPPNGALVRGVAVSPDGRFAYVVHTLGRTTLPTTQLDRGWVNTNGLTIIDLGKRERLATVLLDQLSRGAADPWGLAIADGGRTLWVTVSGTHELGKVDLVGLHKLLDGQLPEGMKDEELRARGFARVWLAIRDDPKARNELTNDLAAMYGARMFVRTGLPVRGPRGIAASPDGKRVAVAGYFTGAVAVADASTGKVERTIPVGPQPEADLVRQGEAIFFDADNCFQGWLSCATCHPEGRADGLNWDLLNDGIGNPKNTRTMVLSAQTPPVMSLGVRDSMEVAAAAGFRFILFRQPEPGQLEALEAYLKSLEPDESPYLDGGKLSAKAAQGKKVFEDARTGCASCHPAGLYTDLRMYDVGTRGELDRADAFDTPTLREIWRTGPYLHDGRAVTVEEVFTKYNEGDRHGRTSHLKPEEIEALAEYLRSL